MAKRKDNKPSVKTLKRTLDELWSKWVRLSNADPDGLVRCCSCGRMYHWKEVDCGHFVSRNHNAGRFDPRNTNPQCKKCNRFREGCKSGYALFLIKKYGVGVIEELHNMQWQIKRFTPDELQQMILDTRLKLKTLSGVIDD
jgi:hypothetical protein